MGRPLIDHTGQKFGRLRVVSQTVCPLRHASDRYRMDSWWNCTCECGADTIKPGSGLRKGRITSCGCYRKEHGKRASMMWQQKRAITPEKIHAIKQSISAGSTVKMIVAQMQISPCRVTAIRKEMRL